MKLTEVEQLLVDHLMAGTMVDLATHMIDGDIGEDVMASWGPEHEIRAQVVRDILRGRHLPKGDPDPRGLQLRGARIVGRLDLDGLTTSITLGLKSCHLPSGLSGDACVIPELDLSHSVFRAPAGSAEDGAVRLAGARIGGQLSMRGAVVTNDTGPALCADQMTVDGGAFLDGGFAATGHGEDGAVRLVGARIGGQLNMMGAIVTNDTGPALIADGVTVGGGAFLDDGFAAGHSERGAVRLLGASVGRQLSMSGAIVTNNTGPTLCADRMTVDGDAFLDRGFEAIGHGEGGAVRLLGAHIGGQLNMRGAIVTNDTGPALHAEGVTVDGHALLDAGFAATGHGDAGAVRLLGARIGGQIAVGVASVDRATAGMKWKVDGLMYGGFPTVGVDEWLRLLRDGTTAYSPQPYQRLAAAARAAGHDSDARRILIAQRDDQVKRANLTRRSKAWARFTKLTLGYGYQPWRALIGVAGVLLISVLMVFFVPGAVAHTKTGTPCTEIETFQIAVDIAIPLVTTSAGTTCHVTSTVGGQLVGWAGVGLTFFGWALTALFAAGFTSAIRKS